MPPKKQNESPPPESLPPVAPAAPKPPEPPKPPTPLERLLNLLDPVIDQVGSKASRRALRNLCAELRKA